MAISERTLYRDLRELRGLGFEISYSDGYQLQERLPLEGAGLGSLASLYERQLALVQAQLPPALAGRVLADVEAMAPAALSSLFAGAIQRQLSDGRSRP
jgi:predicted DNA-binding transcriptional regulator YafY